MTSMVIADQQLLDLERIRAEINRLIASPLLEHANREKLTKRLEDVAELRSEWERIRGTR